MYQLAVVLTLKDGSKVEGEAKDTLRNEQKQECILVVQHGVDVTVVLNELRSMKAKVENPHFDFVEFNQEG